MTGPRRVVADRRVRPVLLVAAALFVAALLALSPSVERHEDGAYRVTAAGDGSAFEPEVVVRSGELVVEDLSEAR